MGKFKLVIISFFIILFANLFGKDYNITDFGARPGLKHINTAAVQKAVDKCSEEGGEVIFPPGRWITGTIFLKDNVSIYLAKNAIWQGSKKSEDFPFLEPKVESREDKDRRRAMIYALQKSNIHIHGQGTLYPGGDYEIYATTGAYSKYYFRPFGIWMIECQDIEVEGIKMKNSAFWMQRYLNCDNLTLHNLDIYNHSNLNNDGIDIDGCHDVIISDCKIDASDDALCLKSEGHRAVRNVVVTNCILSTHASAFKLGTGSVGGFEGITLSNCVVRPSKSDTMIHVLDAWGGLVGIELLSVDGGYLRNINIANVVIEGVETPIHLKLGKRHSRVPAGSKEPSPGTLENISFDNITIYDAGRISSAITGYPGRYVENISFSNINLQSAGGGTAADTTMDVLEAARNYPVNRMYQSNLPSYGFYLRHVKNITFQNVNIDRINKDVRAAFVLDDVHSAYFDNVNIKKQNPSQPLFKLNNSTGINFDVHSDVKRVAEFIRVQGEKSANINLENPEFEILEEPAPPLKFNAEAKLDSYSYMELEWTAPDIEHNGLFSYAIYRNGRRIATTRKTNYLDNKNIKNKRYTYEVVTINNNGQESKKLKTRIKGKQDVVAPAIIKHNVIDSETISLLFSEPLDTNWNISNHISFNPTVRVISSEYGDNASKVYVKIEGLQTNRDYKLKIDEIRDKAGNSKTIIANIKDKPVAGFWDFDKVVNGKIINRTSAEQICKVHNTKLEKGVKGKSLKCNGRNSYVRCEPKEILNLTGNMAVSVWIKLADPDLSAYTRVLSKKKKWNDTTGYELEITPDINKINFCGGSRVVSQQGAVEYPLSDEWHHLVAVKKGKKMDFFIDNEYYGSDPYAVDAQKNDIPLIIGSNPALNAFFYGNIDELILFKRALSENEIDKLHNFNYDWMNLNE